MVTRKNSGEPSPGIKKHRVPVIMKHPPHPKTAILIPAPAGFFIGLTALQNGLFNPVISCWISAAVRDFYPRVCIKER
jgi:hypothetical protein